MGMRALVMAIVVVLGTEGLALACGAEAPPNDISLCKTMTISTPGETFPLNLAATEIVVSVNQKESFQGAQSTVEDAFPLTQPLHVFRALEGAGFEEVTFSLDEGPGLVKGARLLHLEDPRAGHYYASWEGDTCRTQVSPAGGGKAIDDFTVTPAAPIPATLGTLSAAVAKTKGRDFQEGVGASCEPIMIHVDETVATFTLAPSADLAPWTEALRPILEVDGANMGGGTNTPDDVKTGRYRIEVVRTCASDTPRYVQSPGISEGTHKARMVAHLTGQDLVVTPEVTFEVHCDLSSVSENEYVPSATRDGGVDRAPAHADGCNASGGESGGQSVPPSTFAMLGLALAASGVRRARRSREPSEGPLRRVLRRGP